MSEWIEWSGGEMPVPKGTPIAVKHRDGGVFYCSAGSGYSYLWGHSGANGDIVAYLVLGGVVTNETEQKHSHYYKDCPYDKIDYYRIAELYSITDPAIGHCVKKLLCAGNRGHKDLHKDIQDCIDTLVRWQAMRKEDEECLNKP